MVPSRPSQAVAIPPRLVARAPCCGYKRMSKLERDAAGRWDVETARLALAGDAAARHELVERLTCVPRFLRCRNDRFGRMLPEHEVQDLTQDILAAIWAKLATFRGESDFEGWAFRFCDLQLRNHVRRFLKRRRREHSSADVDLAAAPTEGMHELDVSHQVIELLDRLEGEEAQILRWRFLDDLEFAAIAGKLRKPMNTVKTRFYRALRRLHEWTARRHEEGDV